MEIITIVLDGELEHKDSTGVTEVIHYGDIQVMSAGSGIIHSEYNHSKTKKLELFQIWIETKENNIKPRHAKRTFNFKNNTLTKIVSGENNLKISSKDQLYIHQDARIFFGKYSEKTKLTYKIQKENGVFIFLIDGELSVDNTLLHKRDAVSILKSSSINIEVNKNTRFVIIEVPMN